MKLRQLSVELREAAARSKCQNNLAQISKGIHNYESANGTFLPGVSRTGCPFGENCLRK